MDIKILDSHLRQFLETNAKSQDIAKYVSLSGPTFDRTHDLKGDYAYEIEVTTNRIDAASAYGIAREASAILPQYKFEAKLKPLHYAVQKAGVPKPLPLILKNDPKLVNRLTGIIIGNIKNRNTPKWMVDRLKTAGIRPLNAIVDITNYVMITLGHPCHAFDYDKIKNHTIIVRESRKGETVTSFDGKTYSLPGGDIVFADTDDTIIDLPGIIGTKNSVVSDNTERVLLFFDNNDPVRTRKTSMTLGIRTMAATINEKAVDPEIIPSALAYGAELFKNICNASLLSNVYDVYPNKPESRRIKTSLSFIKQILGIQIDKKRIDTILNALSFKTHWSGDSLTVHVPSFRVNDISIPEDLIEEIARIYGYHNLPSELMTGKLPASPDELTFDFEDKIRNKLASLGGIEVLTYSLVSKDMAGAGALRLENALGSDSEYLRTSLIPSLLDAVHNNPGEEKSFHLFEIANVFRPNKNDLPKETMMVAGVFKNVNFRNAKGVLEALFESINCVVAPKLIMHRGVFCYQYEINEIISKLKPPTYRPIPKYPPQIEDITVTIEPGQKTGNIIHSIKQASSLVSNVELVDVYSRNFTFRIFYQHPDKTLTDKEVEDARAKINSRLGL